MCQAGMPMPAPARMYAHARSVRSSQPADDDPAVAPQKLLGQRRGSSAGISDRSMPDHAVVVEVQVRKLAVAGL